MALTDWQGKSVFITGHTGFKGSWLSLILSQLGAKVHGFSLNPLEKTCLFNEANVHDHLAEHTIADIREYQSLKQALDRAKPEIVFHLAAQPLVRESYRSPLETYSSNVMGTANLLEALRHSSYTKSAVFITTDKVYQNKEWLWAYRESERLGGHDPYSASKACSELVIDSYRQSFFEKSECWIATARAGNIIGGGDWSKDRLVPDIIRAVQEASVLSIRSPEAIRPWQHVIEPLYGYMLLALALCERKDEARSAFNLGPKDSDCQNVRFICARAESHFKDRLRVEYYDQRKDLHEANFLKLDSTKAKVQLSWQTLLPLEKALDWTFAWYEQHAAGESAASLSTKNIQQYFQLILGTT